MNEWAWLTGYLSLLEPARRWYANKRMRASNFNTEGSPWDHVTDPSSRTGDGPEISRICTRNVNLSGASGPPLLVIGVGFSDKDCDKCSVKSVRCVVRIQQISSRF